MKEDHLKKLQQFRGQLCICFRKRAAAAFNLIDALASAVKVESPIELSQSPAFERKYASVYDVLTESELDGDHSKVWGVELTGLILQGGIPALEGVE